jgi:hypothetical protein
MDVSLEALYTSPSPPLRAHINGQARTHTWLGTHTYIDRRLIGYTCCCAALRRAAATCGLPRCAPMRTWCTHSCSTLCAATLRRTCVSVRSSYARAATCVQEDARVRKAAIDVASSVVVPRRGERWLASSYPQNVASLTRCGFFWSRRLPRPMGVLSNHQTAGVHLAPI